jgi:hypothetical protein
MQTAYSASQKQTGLIVVDWLVLVYKAEAKFTLQIDLS